MFSIIGKKLELRGQVTQRISHHLRGHSVAHADPARAGANVSSWEGDARDLVDEIWKRTERAMVRRDGVRVIELLLTASPDWSAHDMATPQPSPKSI